MTRPRKYADSGRDRPTQGGKGPAGAWDPEKRGPERWVSARAAGPARRLTAYERLQLNYAPPGKPYKPEDPRGSWDRQGRLLEAQTAVRTGKEARAYAKLDEINRRWLERSRK